MSASFKHEGGMSRRTFLKVTGCTGGGLLISFVLQPGKMAGADSTGARGFEMNAFVSIETCGRVTIMAPVPEIGQGVRTALPMIVAEELDVCWEQVVVLQAPADARYGAQAVGGSDSVADYWAPLRQAGATARTMLVDAAVLSWGVEPGSCSSRLGKVVHHPTGRILSYGSLAELASTLPVPEHVVLKDPSDFHIIGQPLPRVDLPDITTGEAKYGIDVRLPKMRYAVIERCPVHQGKVRVVDDTAARRVPGVVDVHKIGPLGVSDRYGAVRAGVAVIADNPWAAMKGREQLRVRWDEGRWQQESSSRIAARFAELRDRPGLTTVRRKGDVRISQSGVKIEVKAEYQLPLLGHACMEPMCFTADLRSDRCELWGPTQAPQNLQRLVAALTRLPLETVVVHTTLEGGGFGRRLAYDYGVEAVLVSRAVGGPVQVLWTREDDIRHDYFRTPSYHSMFAALDDKHHVIAWRHHVITSPIRWQSAGPDTEHPELYELEGAANLPYETIPNILVEYTPIDVGIQIGSWRSVAHSYNVFAVNTFVDEIAAAAGRDSLELQLELLGTPRKVEIELPLPGRRGRPHWDTGRLRRVLELAARKARWGSDLPAGRGRGLACGYFKRTYVAHVAEVELDGNDLAVRRVVTAIDCGRVINPDGVEAQVDGSVMDAVATVLNWEITLEGGRVRQSNFDTYPLLRISEAPTVEVHIVASEEDPSGTGEPPYPAAVPAITNAISAATGQRVRRLPWCVS